ncbi:keratin-associated protein 10-11-like isoform X2 [Mizuhopecten yessoensis]|uniref:keratin-associated protein 10-11-like isoform X2 n=1 Tax=Mizuhopecten yessoensis TaxID=6573 RepID=UPI000B45D073|nr:keratin-associated protein 10-11-like isoform X2 [Mizuhopecten yessoensis]
MANMYVICLVFVLIMAVVQCITPTCTPSACEISKTCKWTCDKNGLQIADANNTVCTVSKAVCGSSGECKSACVAAPVAATCTPDPCPGGKPCKWTCEKSDHTPIVGAYITACTRESGPCGSAADSGTCKAACVPPTDKSGSIRLGVSPLMLICVIFTKLFLYP